MSQKLKKKPLFKVAKEFNVATRTIVNSLESEGYEATDKPNFKVTPEMYAALERLYGGDKASREEHIKAREEYEERRTSMKNTRHQSVSVDNFLDPIEELEPKEEEKEPPRLEPLEGQEAEAAQTEEAQDDTSVAEAEQEAKAPEQSRDTSEDSDESDEKEKEIEPPIPAEEEEEEEEEEEGEPEPALDDGEKDTAEPEDTPQEQDQSVEEQADDLPKEAEAEEEKEVVRNEKGEIIRGRARKLSGTRVLGKIDVNKGGSKEESGKGKTRSGKKKSKKEESGGQQEAKTQESKEEQTQDNKAKKPADKQEKEKQDEADKKQKKKKVKSKSKRVKEEESKDTKDKGKDEKAKSGEESKSSAKKKRMKSRKSKTQVDESDVESKMKETMQMLNTSATGGKKRQKRRRQKRDEMAAEREKQAEIEQQDQYVLEVTEFMTVSDLAELLDVNPTEIITHCMNLGMVVSINQRLDANTLELLADEYDREIRFVDAEELTEEIEEEEEENPEDLEPRAPVVTVMGHVDHGKTSILDYIRETHVTAGEAGGITQHIGAHEVVTDTGRKITFLDTPGHEAFTAMRARGAQVTDLVILVVAADDQVMPQTVEAINHAQAAGVSIVLAINKVDKEGANADRIRQQLSEHNVVVEEWGGKTQTAMVSAKFGDGMPELLEKILIEAELMDLKANPSRKASGIVLESRVDKGKGVVANILVQKGTLKLSDPFVAGQYYGRVRAMENEKGERLKEIGPSTPAQLIGFHGLPQAGDRLVAMEDEKSAKEIAMQRQQIRREQELRKVKHASLDDISRQMALGEIAELNLIIKGDVDGSIEALSGSLQKLGTDEVKVNIIHTGVGAISESDVLLASASNAIIIGFQVRPTPKAREISEQEEIDIRLFSVIYEAVDAVRDALEGMLSPEINEKITGTVEVREVFKVPKVGNVAGCFVRDGKIHRNSKIRLVRDGIVINEGELDSLKRFKDDVKEVQSGYECGMNIKNYNDIKVGDIIEAFEMVETKRTLTDEPR